MLGGGRAAAGGTRLHRRRLLYSVGRLDGHAGGNAVRGDARGDAVLLALHLRHDRLRGEHDAGDAAGVGEAGAGDLGGVQDAALQQVLHLAVHRVVPVLPRQPLQLLHHHLAVHAAVERNQLERRRDRLHHDVRTKALLLVGQRRFELGHLRVTGGSAGGAYKAVFLTETSEHSDTSFRGCVKSKGCILKVPHMKAT